MLTHRKFTQPERNTPYASLKHQLMGAVVGVITESLTESIRGFYKLRKAYITLSGIVEAEGKYKAEKSVSSVSSRSGSPSHIGPTAHSNDRDATTRAVKRATNSTLEDSKTKEKGETSTFTTDEDSDDDGDEFHDAEEATYGAEKLHDYVGKLDLNDHDAPRKQTSNPNTSMKPKIERSSDTDGKQFSLAADVSAETGYIDSEIYDNPVDAFIHSGSNMAFGLLLLLISLIPPAFATLFKIVGFSGDKERGINLLWQASKYKNVYGALSGLILFGFYNGLIGFCDIIPESGVNAYPQARLQALLADMQRRYPKSHMWQLEEARMAAGDRNLEKAVQLLTDASISPLKQVEALRSFENALNNMYLHSYEATSAAFQKV